MASHWVDKRNGLHKLTQNVLQDLFVCMFLVCLFLHLNVYTHITPFTCYLRWDHQCLLWPRGDYGLGTIPPALVPGVMATKLKRPDNLEVDRQTPQPAIS